MDSGEVPPRRDEVICEVCCIYCCSCGCFDAGEEGVMYGGDAGEEGVMYGRDAGVIQLVA